ncbi:MAG: HAD-IIB family hydrolase [Thermodesulfobacteriota bacterium]|nr:HAD-IIB family hydrolase [Thermodesulfobacteriota bacterium]
MKLISEISISECRKVRGVFFDIDDTVTFKGKILKDAYSALWALHKAGLFTVPITGRPAGWCDHIARMWPVDGIIGENGAFYFYYNEQEGRLLHRYFSPPEEIVKKKKEIEAIKKEILTEVPRARVATDQPYRLFDLAIDFSEDVVPLTNGEIEVICNIFSEHGARYKISSIHVNGWFGDYDKLTMTRLFIKERLSMDEKEAEEKFLFIGDSPNDEPMFEAFSLSVGVANIKRFITKMEFLPKYITLGSGSLGFAEMASIILKRRNINKRSKICQ